MANVTVRKKQIGKGRIALYTDTYPVPADGNRTRTLNLYLTANPRSPVERRRNREILDQAEAIAAKRQNEINKPEIYSLQELEMLDGKIEDSVFAFCKSRLSKLACESTEAVYKVAVGYFLQYAGDPSLLFRELTVLYLQEFRQFILNAKKMKGAGTISRTSASVYFAAIKSLISDAYAGGLIRKDISAEVEKIVPVQKHREGFSLEELKALKQTECNCPLLKEAALFSALTGLRFIDIVQLDRKSIKKNKQGWYLDFIQEKTDGGNVLPISDQAYSLIPVGEKSETAKQDSTPFSKLDYQRMQRPLKKWFADAGVERNATFHYFRHTYALLLLKSDIDILTVSSMMGHKSIQSTQVYAKALLTNKINAANSIAI